MNIEALGAGASSATLPSKRVTSADFMKLLTTQLSNQNPLEPVTDAEFLGQLAQFSSLEETQAQRTAIEQLTRTLSANASLQGLAQASSLIGKSIEYVDPEVGNEVTAQVRGVQFADGIIQLDIGESFLVPLGNVVGISDESPTSASGSEPATGASAADPDPAEEPSEDESEDENI